MDENRISGKRQYDFVAAFSYSRESGTPGEQRAAGQILNVLQEAGIPGKSEPFVYKKVCAKKSELQVRSPYQKTYPVTILIYDRPLTGNLTAPFLYVENGDEISLLHAKGKIIFVNEPLKPDTVRRICASGALAYVSIYGTPLDEGKDRIPAERAMGVFREDMIPGARMHMKDVWELISNGAEEVSLVFEQELREITSWNVTARIEGSRFPEEMMTLTAHYDSVPVGLGAYDNIAGCAIIMELCKYFSRHRPFRTLEFVWLGAEEKGLHGSKAYVQAHEAELWRHRFHMNVDLAGQMLGGTVAGVTAGDEVCEFIFDTAKRAGKGLEIKKQIWSSDSNTFAWKGIPAMTLNRDGFGMHTSYDTIDLISAWSLERSAVILGLIAEACDQADVFPFERTVPEEFQVQLKKYFEAK